jgi:hypothetical protein
MSKDISQKFHDDCVSLFGSMQYFRPAGPQYIDLGGFFNASHQYITRSLDEMTISMREKKDSNVVAIGGIGIKNEGATSEKVQEFADLVSALKPQHIGLCLEYKYRKHTMDFFSKLTGVIPSVNIDAFSPGLTKQEAKQIAFSLQKLGVQALTISNSAYKDKKDQIQAAMTILDSTTPNSAPYWQGKSVTFSDCSDAIVKYYIMLLAADVGVKHLGFGSDGIAATTTTIEKMLYAANGKIESLACYFSDCLSPVCTSTTVDGLKNGAKVVLDFVERSGCAMNLNISGLDYKTTQQFQALLKNNRQHQSPRGLVISQSLDVVVSRSLATSSTSSNITSTHSTLLPMEPAIRQYPTKSKATTPSSPPDISYKLVASYLNQGDYSRFARSTKTLNSILGNALNASGTIMIDMSKLSAIANKLVTNIPSLRWKQQIILKGKCPEQAGNATIDEENKQSFIRILAYFKPQSLCIESKLPNGLLSAAISALPQLRNSLETLILRNHEHDNTLKDFLNQCIHLKTLEIESSAENITNHLLEPAQNGVLSQLTSLSLKSSALNDASLLTITAKCPALQTLSLEGKISNAPEAPALHANVSFVSDMLRPCRELQHLSLISPDKTTHITAEQVLNAAYQGQFQNLHSLNIPYCKELKEILNYCSNLTVLSTNGANRTGTGYYRGIDPARTEIDFVLQERKNAQIAATIQSVLPYRIIEADRQVTKEISQVRGQCI